MKKILISIVLLFSIQQLSAFSIGKEGQPYFENSIEWQPVKYDDDDAGFYMAFPEMPKCGLSNGDVYAYSKYKNVHYEMHTSLSGRFLPPKKEYDFMMLVNDAFAAEAEILVIPSSQKNVKYIAEIYWNKMGKVVRLYCSSNQLYWVIVEGEDLTLAPLFFDTVNITK